MRNIKENFHFRLRFSPGQNCIFLVTLKFTEIPIITKCFAFSYLREYNFQLGELIGIISRDYKISSSYICNN